MAVFSPIPLTPGILSEASPDKAFKSIILIGSIPYSSINDVLVYLTKSLDFNIFMWTLGVINCNKS